MTYITILIFMCVTNDQNAHFRKFYLMTKLHIDSIFNIFSIFIQILLLCFQNFSLEL